MIDAGASIRILCELCLIMLTSEQCQEATAADRYGTRRDYKLIKGMDMDKLVSSMGALQVILCIRYWLYAEGDTCLRTRSSSFFAVRNDICR